MAMDMYRFSTTTTTLGLVGRNFLTASPSMHLGSSRMVSMLSGYETPSASSPNISVSASVAIDFITRAFMKSQTAMPSSFSITCANTWIASCTCDLVVILDLVIALRFRSCLSFLRSALSSLTLSRRVSRDSVGSVNFLNATAAYESNAAASHSDDSNSSSSVEAGGWISLTRAAAAAAAGAGAAVPLDDDGWPVPGAAASFLVSALPSSSLRSARALPDWSNPAVAFIRMLIFLVAPLNFFSRFFFRLYSM